MSPFIHFLDVICGLRVLQFRDRQVIVVSPVAVDSVSWVTAAHQIHTHMAVYRHCWLFKRSARFIQGCKSS